MKDKYYNQIKNLLIDNEIYQRVKNYSKEKNKVITYYETGKLLADAGKHYGENIIGKYSIKLMNEVGKKYSTTLLKRMRQFYWMIEKGAPLGHQLTWSHYRELIPIKDINKIKYYIRISIEQHLSRDSLRNHIKSKEYERLSDNTKLKLIEHKETNVFDFVKNPIVIENNLNYEKICEKALQQLILENIPNFLKELGNGFCFIENEYKIKLGSTNNYIDILLYNYIFKCFIVVELKVTKLKKEHIGQIKLYMNYIDKHIKDVFDNNTIGLIISRKNNRYVIEYSTDSRIGFKEFIIN